MGKRAIILAGGKGTRLKPYTISLPKPLVPLDETPILEVIIMQLKKAGFDHITLAVNHMSEIIKDFCEDGSKWSIKIDYSLETKPLSTMGPLKLINNLPENFLVMNGDILTNLDFKSFYENHVSEKKIFTISSVQYKSAIVAKDAITKFMISPILKNVEMRDGFRAPKFTLIKGEIPSPTP